MKRSFAFKLNIATIILLSSILISGLYSILMINKSQEYAHETGINWLPSVNLLAGISENIGQISRRHVTIIGNYLTNQEKEKIESDKAKLNEFISALEKKMGEYPNFISDAEEKNLFNTLSNAWKATNEEIIKDLKDLEEGKASLVFETYNSKTLNLFVQTTKALEELTNYNAKGAYDSTKSGAYLTKLTNISMTLILIFSAIVTLTIFIINLKSLKSISKSVADLKSQSKETNKIAHVLNDDSQKLSKSATEQANSVHETSSSIEEITSMVNRTAENAKESTEVASNASNKAEDGQVTMRKLVTAMETIQDSNAQLQNIATIINQINTKTAVINDIVSKTELLSLNASIESARAGEYGKGFAVVAEEVGNLAKISGKSANEIQELITSSQEQVNKILELTKERVEEGKKVTAEAQDAFQQISEDISNMSSVIVQISDATREQEIGVRQISTAMTNIDRATQTSNAAVKTTSEAAEILLNQTKTLDFTANEIDSLIQGSI